MSVDNEVHQLDNIQILEGPCVLDDLGHRLLKEEVTRTIHETLNSATSNVIPKYLQSSVCNKTSENVCKN